MSGSELTESDAPRTSPATRRCMDVALFGLLLTLAGPVVYIVWMTNPWVRSTGVPAFLLMVVGSLLGIRALRQDRRLLARTVGGLSPLLTVLFAYLFFWGLALPESSRFETLQIAPAFVLPDEEGRPVSLEELTATGPAMLVFYRGYW